MNKFVLLLILSLTINISYCDDSIPLDLDSFYKYIVYLLKGLSSAKECECSIIFEKNKDEIISIIKAFIEDYKRGANLFDLAFTYVWKLASIEDLLTKCKLLDANKLLDLLKSQDGIEKIGEIIFNSADEIGELLKKAKDSGNTEEIFIIIGKIISFIFDFYVN